MSAPTPPPLRVTIEFGGGLEVLFGGQKRLPSLALPADVRTITLSYTFFEVAGMGGKS